MAEHPSTSNTLLFEDFIEYIRQHGFSIGIDHHLRLQSLLNKVAGNCSPEDLKTLLCPIFATDYRQQEFFYNTFDSFFNFDKGEESEKRESRPAAKESIEEEKPKGERPQPSKKKRYVLIGVFTLLFTGVILYLAIGSSTGPPPAQVSPTPNPSIEFQNVNAQSTREQLEENQVFRLRLLAILLPLLLLLLYELYRYRRFKDLHKSLRSKNPPSILLQIRAFSRDIYDLERLSSAARLLRRRQITASQYLDIWASITATIKSLGFPTLRQKAGSKPSEYLVLIDRASYQDHQAHLFDELTHALIREDVLISRYFYEGDPRVCFAQAYTRRSNSLTIRSIEAQRRFAREQSEAEQGIHLEDLQDLHTGKRLIIFGDGDELVDPVTGEMAEWTKVFTHWQERATLSPYSPRQWGEMESLLASQFIVLPATLEGLELLAECFDLREQVGLPKHLLNDPQLPRGNFESLEIIPQVKQYLGEKAFQWLCACAVHPELQWDLTLHLGSLLYEDDDLMAERNLLRLIRLPWFRSGSIPEPLRDSLIRQLEPEKEEIVRQEIFRLLESPKLDQRENESGLLKMAVSMRFYQRYQEKFLDAVSSTTTALRGQFFRDSTAAHFLDAPFYSLIGRLLPGWLRKILFTPFGVRPIVLRAALALLALITMALLWIIIPPISKALEPELPIDNPSFSSTPEPTQNSTPNPAQNVNSSPSPPPVGFPSPTPAPSQQVTFATPETSPIAIASPTQQPTTTPVPQGTQCVRIVNCPPQSATISSFQGTLTAQLTNYTFQGGFDNPGCQWKAVPESALLPNPDNSFDCSIMLNLNGFGGQTVRITVEGGGVSFAPGCSTSDSCIIRVAGGATPTPTQTPAATPESGMGDGLDRSGRDTQSPDGNVIARRSDSDIIILDRKSGKEIATLNGTDYVVDVAFSPDGKMLASADRATIIKVWDVQTRKELLKFRVGSREIEYIIFGRDGRTITVVAGDETLIYSVITGQRLK